MLKQQARSPHARLRSKLGLRAPDMFVHGRLHQAEVGRDLLGLFELGDAQQTFPLARGQLVEAVHGSASPA